MDVAMAGAAERDLVLGRLGGRVLASTHALGLDVMLVELADRATYFALTIVNPTGVANGAVRGDFSCSHDSIIHCDGTLSRLLASPMVLLSTLRSPTSTEG
jgi:hypothetical protein